MATPLKVPQLGVTMTEATVARWLKAPGDAVRKGEPLVEIETDKLNSEAPASADGVLRRVLAPEGAVLPVGGLLGVIGAADEPEAAIDAVAAGAAGVGRTTAPAARSAPPAPPAAPSAAGTPSMGQRATPLARRMAADQQVDLAAVRGSGPGGRITQADVQAATAEPVNRAAPSPTAAPEPDGFVRASPIARRLARERGLDLRAIRGSGPDGRVVERDILAVADAAAAPPPPSAGLRVRETIRADGMRRLIGQRMLESLQRSAQLTLTTEADATSLVELRAHLVPAARVYGHRPPTYTDLLVHLVARVLREHPLLNSSLLGAGADQAIVCWDDVNIGVAVALERGLLVPVLRHADAKGLDAIAQELGDLAERAHANRLTPDDLADGTFTITNLGALEIDGFTPILNPPQCAILGVGRIAPKPAVHEGQIMARQLLTLSLTFDHRIVDGAPAAAFLRDVKRAIEAVGEAGLPA